MKRKCNSVTCRGGEWVRCGSSDTHEHDGKCFDRSYWVCEEHCHNEIGCTKVKGVLLLVGI